LAEVAKTYQSINFKVKCKSPKHLHLTTLETLKYKSRVETSHKIGQVKSSLNGEILPNLVTLATNIKLDSIKNYYLDN
jgi:hypothetical protein